jgi:hypothetical protein
MRAFSLRRRMPPFRCITLSATTSDSERSSDRSCSRAGRSVVPHSKAPRTDGRNPTYRVAARTSMARRRSNSRRSTKNSALNASVCGLTARILRCLQRCYRGTDWRHQHRLAGQPLSNREAHSWGCLRGSPVIPTGLPIAFQRLTIAECGQ